MTLSASIEELGQQVAEEFELFDDWMGRYEYLIEMGRSLPMIDDKFKTDEYLVRGCQSRVWLRAEADGDTIRLTADSDALITKGLVAVLLRVLSGQPAEAVARADLHFLDQIGMKEHLSPTRKNGLDAMIKRIRLSALALSHSSETS